jgi:glycine/D-amino acid oxidase-like deaminating enzyme
MALSRRAFLGASSLFASGCAVRRAGVAPPAPGARLARVRVSPDRVIRVTTGLRPFRPSGFVVRAERMGDKVVVHNYGHGGAGITLSWGTAQLAVDAADAAKMGARDCVVIGCGVVGLTTAILLQQRGYRPIVFAKEVPPNTTSNFAGGLWEPVSLYDHTRVTPEFRKQFGDAARFSYRRYQSLAGDYYGVRWLPCYSLSNDAPSTPSPDSPMREIDALHPESRQLTQPEHPFNVAYASRKQSMLIEPAIYLSALMRDFELGGGRIVVREFSSTTQILALPQTLFFNCTGLGAKALFNDEELTPVKGQLVFLLPQPEVEYMTIGPGDIYMFPRHDGILLGGSHDSGLWNMDADPAVTERILKENGALFGGMRA